ncbi:hypothetical protein DRN44_07870 [Thermococci archaeon]|nr:MAG: hypothetical protein DRN44_07870 [Thermococci archaeon]
MLKLKVWEEIVGILNDLRVNNGKLILSISSSINVEIPNQLVNKKMLEKILGHRVGVLRTDSGYLIRVFKATNANYVAHDRKRKHRCNSSPACL